jgi:hypothetical protein
MQNVLELEPEGQIGGGLRAGEKRIRRRQEGIIACCK